ncbi:MAG: recombinase RecA [Actinomycetota bacterium]
MYGPEGSGKCLTGDTYIWTDHGLETVVELFERCGQKASCTSRVTDVTELGVRAVNEHGELEQIAALTNNNRRPVLKLRLRSGRTVTATHNHPLRVVDQSGYIVWRKVGEIVQGDTVVSAGFGAIEAASGDGVSEDEAVFLGYLVAEGTLTGTSRVRSTNWDKEVAEEFVRLARDLFGVEARNYYDKEYDLSGKALRVQLEQQYGLDYVTAHGKKIPRCVRTGGHKIQRAFLSALFEGDGWIDKSSTVGIASASEQLAREVQLLLFGFGIPATVTAKHNLLYERDYWTVTIAPAVVHRFLDEIGFRSARRQAQVAASFRRPRCDSPFDSIPNLGRYTYERVEEIVDAGIQPTFDLALPRTHSFIANGVLSHNTTVSLHVIAEAQKSGGLVAFIDAEHALDPTYAKALGVDTDGLLVSQPDTGEQALEIADTLVRSGAMDVIVVDSVAALVPRAEIEGEMGDTHVGLQARLMSQALRKLAGNVNRSRTILIFINQLREKIGVMFGSPETTPGGRALKFYSSVRLDVRRIDALKDGAEVVGSRVRVKVVKNKVSAPFKKAEFDIQYGYGISKEGSLLDVAIDNGIVRKSGAWFIYGDDQLGQGRENAKTFLADNADIAAEIELKIKEKLGLLAAGPDAEQGASAGAPAPTPAPTPTPMRAGALGPEEDL